MILFHFLFIFFLFFLSTVKFSERQHQRFRSSLLAYLDGAAEERKLHEVQATTEEYLRIRRKGSGTDIFIRMAEAVVGCDLSAYVDDSIFQQNEDAIINISSWLNDLYSYNREMAYKERSNLVYHLLVNNKEMKPQQAYDKGTLMMYEWVEIWKVTSKQLLLKYPDDQGLARYLDELNSWYTGNQVFSYNNPRYAEYNKNVSLKRFL